MTMHFHYSLFYIWLSLLLVFSSGVIAIPANVSDYLTHMSVDEKIGTVMMLGYSSNVSESDLDRAISMHFLSGVMIYGQNIPSGTILRDRHRRLQAQRFRPAYPLLIAVDQEGGSVQRVKQGVRHIPSHREMAKKYSPEDVANIANHLGSELRNIGFNINFAPVIDVDSNPKNPVIGSRSFSSDPVSVSDYGIAFYSGLARAGIFGVPKHFPGHGDTDSDSHIEAAISRHSYERLTAVELYPFKTLISKGASMIMVSHVTVSTVDPIYPSSLSHEVIQGILRNTLHFSGVTISDDLSMGALRSFGTLPTIAVLAFSSGIDLLLFTGTLNDAIAIKMAMKQSLKNGTLSMKRLDEAVWRILHLRATQPF